MPGLARSAASIVGKARATIQDIVNSAHHVNRRLGEVATGAQEQSTGSAQTGQAGQDLDRMTQHNATLVEQTAAAPSALNEQAIALAVDVSRFKLPA